MRVILALLITAPLWGTVDYVAGHRNRFTITGSAAGTITSTNSGNLLAITVTLVTGTDSVTSITCAGCTCTTANARAVESGHEAVESWYCGTLPAGVTSLTVNQTGSGTVYVVTRELHSTVAGTLVLLAAGASSATSASSHAQGPSLTLPSTATVIAYEASFVFTASAITAPYTELFTDLGGYGSNSYAIDQPAGTSQADWTINNGGSIAYVRTAAAYGLAVSTKVQRRVIQ